MRRSVLYDNVCSAQWDLAITDGKEPSLLGFSSVRVLTKLSVRFGSVRVLHKCRKFGFGSGSVLIISVLSSVLYEFDGFKFSYTSVITKSVQVQFDSDSHLY